TAPLLSGTTLPLSAIVGPSIALPSVTATLGRPRVLSAAAGFDIGQRDTAGASGFARFGRRRNSPSSSCWRVTTLPPAPPAADRASSSATVTTTPGAPVHGVPTTYSSGLRFCGIAPRRSRGAGR